MEYRTLRRFIREKLADGRLPRDSVPGVWGGADGDETCDACGELLTQEEFLMEGAPRSTYERSVQFHVACFNIWDEERALSVAGVRDAQ